MSAGQEQRLKSGDYRGWDEYNVDKECAKVDKAEPVEDKKPGITPTTKPKLSEKGEQLYY